MPFLKFRANGRNIVGFYMTHSFATPQKNPGASGAKTDSNKEAKAKYVLLLIFFFSFFFGDACSSKATVSQEQMDLNVAIKGAKVPEEGLSRSTGRKKKKKRK